MQVLQFNELDPRATMESQLADMGGAVVLLNVFTVEPEEADALVEAWSAEAEFLKTQPGYISTQLHQGVGGRSMYVNYAVWESAAAYAAAFHHPEFKEAAKQFPASVTALPHLIRKIAVPGQCVR